MWDKRKINEKVKQKTLSVIADGGGKGFGATDHASPSGCHIHHPNYSKTKDIGEIPDVSRKYKIKPGHKVEPVIFEPQRKIKLSRSTYKVNSYIDFKPYKETFK